MAPAGDPSGWSVDDVCAFLLGLELDTVVPAFKTNAVNGSDLLELTDAELSGDLGCTSLQVRKIRKGIAATLDAASTGGAPAAAPATAAAPPAAAPAPTPAPVDHGPPPPGYPTVSPAGGAPAGAPWMGSMPPPMPGAAPAAAAPAAPPPVAPANLPPLQPKPVDEGDAARLKEVQAKLAELAVGQAPEAALSAAQQSVAQLNAQLGSAQKNQAEAQRLATEAKAKVEKYTGGGWFPGKALKGEQPGNAAKEELAKAQAAADAQAQRAGELQRQLEAARADVAAAQSRQSQLAALRAEEGEIRARLVSAQAAGDGGLAQLAAQEHDLAGQHQKASSAAHSYGRAAQLLQEGMSGLQAAMQKLQRSGQMARMGTVGAIMRPGPALGPRAARAPMPMMLAQNMQVGGAEKEAKAACQKVAAAMEICPSLPYVKPAQVKKGMQGALLNALAGGVVGEMAQMAHIQKQLQECALMVSDLQQAMAWIAPKRQAAETHAGQLAGQLAQVQAAKKAREEAAFNAAMAQLQVS